MLKVGLTGGIGCGKSTAVDAFRVLGATIIDADQIAKDIVNPEQTALFEITKTFGDQILLKNGSLDRAQLKERIFQDPKALKQLEKILHPKIRLEIAKQISELKNQPYVIIDIPLLVEKNYQALFDRIIVVDCLPKQQLDRVNQRDKLSESEIKKIIQKQASRSERNKHASDILDNTGDVDTLLLQINKLHDEFVSLSTQ